MHLFPTQIANRCPTPHLSRRSFTRAFTCSCLCPKGALESDQTGCESWTVKKAEHRRMDAFELWCWKRLFRVPWTARRSNQSVLKEINPEYSLEGLMLKLQYFGYLMQRGNSLEKNLMLEKIEGKRRRGRQRMRWLAGITNSMDVSLSKLLRAGEGQGNLVCCSPWHHQELDMTERLNNKAL